CRSVVFGLSPIRRRASGSLLPAGAGQLFSVSAPSVGAHLGFSFLLVPVGCVGCQPHPSARIWWFLLSVWCRSLAAALSPIRRRALASPSWGWRSLRSVFAPSLR